MFTQDNLDQVLNGTVVDESGDKIGKVGDIYFDDVTNKPSWVTVNTGLFGTSNSFIPLDNASMEGDTIRVPFSKDKVKDAPRIEADRHLSVEEERELYRYYGADYDNGRDSLAGDPDRGADHGADGDARYANDPDRGADNGADAQAGFAGRTTGTDPDRGADNGADAQAGLAGDRNRTQGEGMVLHEERVNVGTEQREAGRVRLRKHVVTEQQTVTVPVTHEEVRIEREPIRDGEVRDGGLRDGAFQEDSQEVTLHQDEVVVNKEAVATERVSLGTDTVTEQRQVNTEVRREEADIDRTGVQGDRGFADDRGVEGDRLQGDRYDDAPGVGVDRKGNEGADYNNDGKVGLGDKIKGAFDKDKDGHIG